MITCDMYRIIVVVVGNMIDDITRAQAELVTTDIVDLSAVAGV